MNNYLKEIKAIGIFALIGIIVFGFVFILRYFKIETYFYQGLICYVVLCSILAIASTVVNSNILKKVTNIVIFPAGILLAIGTIVLPFVFLLVHVLMYAAIALLIPEALFKIIDYLNIVLFNNYSTILYMKFSLTVFIAVLFNYQLRNLVYKISPARINSSRKLKPYVLDRLTDYLLSENNIRFLIYVTYVVLLSVVNFYNFEGKAFGKSLTNDKAILQSFVTFIAFERALSLLKSLEFKPSDLLNKIGKSIINKFKDLDKNE